MRSEKTTLRQHRGHQLPDVRPRPATRIIAEHRLDTPNQGSCARASPERGPGLASASQLVPLPSSLGEGPETRDMSLKQDPWATFQCPELLGAEGSSMRAVSRGQDGRCCDGCGGRTSVHAEGPPTAEPSQTSPRTSRDPPDPQSRAHVCPGGEVPTVSTHRRGPCKRGAAGTQPAHSGSGRPC